MKKILTLLAMTLAIVLVATGPASACGKHHHKHKHHKKHHHHSQVHHPKPKPKPTPAPPKPKPTNPNMISSTSYCGDLSQLNFTTGTATDPDNNRGYPSLKSQDMFTSFYIPHYFEQFCGVVLVLG